MLKSLFFADLVLVILDVVVMAVMLLPGVVEEEEGVVVPSVVF